MCRWERRLAVERDLTTLARMRTCELRESKTWKNHFNERNNAAQPFGRFATTAYSLFVPFLMSTLNVVQENEELQQRLNEVETAAGHLEDKLGRCAEIFLIFG